MKQDDDDELNDELVERLERMYALSAQAYEKKLEQLSDHSDRMDCMDASQCEIVQKYAQHMREMYAFRNFPHPPQEEGENTASDLLPAPTPNWKRVSLASAIALLLLFGAWRIAGYFAGYFAGYWVKIHVEFTTPQSPKR